MSVSAEDCVRALKEHGGNKTRAAQSLGISRTTLRMKVGESRGADDIDVVEEHRLISENRKVKRDNKQLIQRLAEQTDLGSLMGTASMTNASPPKWLMPKGSRKVERGIITAVLSDCHFDEVVNPEEVNYVNGYNRAIAVARLKSFFINLIKLSEQYINGIKVEGLVMPMIGDMVSGNIHEELKESNEDAIVSTCLYYADQIIAGINLLLEHFETIHVPCVVGNHGRLDKKPRAKGRAKESFDYLIYHLVAREFKNNSDVTFSIPNESDCRYSLYDTRYQLTHGDQFRGGSGIAGMLSPLMIGDHRKRKREQATNTPYDYLVMGHWHQLAFFKGIIVNGSLKGYDEYAIQSNFDFEPPQQAFWVTSPGWGITVRAPIHVIGKNEPWMNNGRT